VGHRIGELVLLGRQRLVLGGVGDGGAVDLVDLELEQVELTGPGPLVAPQTGQGLVQGFQLGPGLEKGRQIDLAVAVQGLPLRSAVEQRLVGVLAVEVDQSAPRVGQRPDGGQAAVDVGPAAAAGGHHPAEHDLVVAHLEPALDHGFVSGGPHEHGIGPAPHQEVDGLDQEGLACAGLTREGGHPRPEHQLEPVDHPEVLDRQFSQHG
jgi:hypothetical protein